MIRSTRLLIHIIQQSVRSISNNGNQLGSLWLFSNRLLAGFSLGLARLSPVYVYLVLHGQADDITRDWASGSRGNINRAHVVATEH